MPARRPGTDPVSPGLTAAGIVATALRIADTDGLDGLTMRRLAAELDVTPMAIYRHVADKNALVGLVVDQVLADLPEPDAAGDWAVQMRRFFTATHELLVAHPAVAQIMAGRPLDGPNATRLADRALACLLAAGFSEDLAVEAFVALGGYTLGGSLYQVGRARWISADSRFDAVPAADRPTLSRLAGRMARARDEGQFSGGLDRLLEGYAFRRAAPAP